MINEPDKYFDRAILKLKNNLYFFLQKGEILLVDPTSLAYLKTKYSDLVIINLLKKPISARKLLQKVIWLNPEIIWEKIKNLYDLGILEINCLRKTKPSITLADEFGEELAKKIKSEDINSLAEKIKHEPQALIKCKNCCWFKICIYLYANSPPPDCYVQKKFFEDLARGKH